MAAVTTFPQFEDFSQNIQQALCPFLKGLAAKRQQKLDITNQMSPAVLNQGFAQLDKFLVNREIIAGDDAAVVFAQNIDKHL